MSEDLKRRKISKEEIDRFIEGHDNQERIVFIDYKNMDKFVTVYYRNEKDQKCTKKEPFYPFCWATRKACLKLCHGDRDKLKKLMSEYKIGVKKLSTTSIDGEDRSNIFDNGYLFMFFAKTPMSYTSFLSFFKKCDNPVYSNNKDDVPSDDDRQYLIVTPQEQFMIATGKRYFKGYNDYNDVYRMTFDLETEGLDPRKCRISQIGIRTNRGFEKILNVFGETENEKNENELKAIVDMLKIIYTYKPDVITAHNGENFDWYFLITRCEMLGTSMEKISTRFFNGDFIRKETKESNLKLGGEVETFFRTVVPQTICTDSLHAVRRAQATDSNFKKADLKYSTNYLGIKKTNRVYTPGEKIFEIWSDLEERYAFNNTNGDWYLYDKNEQSDETDFKMGKIEDQPFKMYKRNYIKEGYELVSGRYIVERYLLDDLWECDKVEWKLNTTNFLICKLLPVPFSKCTTMGTAGQWKALMMAWSFENGLAIPLAENTGSFTGGLSRLLKTGFVDNVIKLDYNSLYPSIILTWAIGDDNDLMNTMLSFLEYVLTEREKYKGLKKKAGKTVDKLKGKVQDGTATEDEIKTYNEAVAEFEFNDKKQNQMKVFGNSFFGSYGSNNGSVFPWKSPKCAEMTTCIGRQSLRLMISHFSNLGYQPIVGDSFSGDTPLFIKYNDTNLISIKTISEMISENKTEVDILGREYDYSKKNYTVLCRSGWVEPSYIYRHKTNKPIYEVSEGDMKIEVTEDHSLFNDKQEKIKPSEITKDTKLEYLSFPSLYKDFNSLSKDDFRAVSKITDNYTALMNASVDIKKEWLNSCNKKSFKTKKMLAIYQYVSNCLK